VKIELFTSRYSDMEDSMGVAVVTSIGEPKFPYDATRRASCKMLAPYGVNMGADIKTFTERYRDRLDNYGVEKIMGRFNLIANEHEEGRLVLLCFEDITKPGKWCHRRLFADWWKEKTGVEIPDIGKSHAQGALL
jgi:hypothetical protein